MVDNNDLKPSILIVDDQENWRGLISDILSDGYQITTASSFEQAKLLISENDYHVLMLDIRLIDSDPGNEQGMLILEGVRKDRGDFDTEIILITGYPTTKTATSALTDFRATHYFVKNDFDFVKFSRVVQEAAERAVARKNEKSLKRHHVLVVEDDLSWQEIIVDVLEKDGYQVEAVTNSQDAVDRLETGLYRLAVVDIKLGQSDISAKDGEKLLTYINTRLPGLQTIVVTGLSSQSIAVDAFQRYNVRAFFQKDGFDLQAFRASVEDAFSMILERHVVAWVESHPVDESLIIAHKYDLKVNVQSGRSLKYDSAPFFIVPSGGIQQLKVVLFAQDMDVQPSLVQTIELSATQQPRPISFQLVPKEMGYKTVSIDVFQSDRFLVNLLMRQIRVN